MRSNSFAALGSEADAAAASPSASTSSSARRRRRSRASSTPADDSGSGGGGGGKGDVTTKRNFRFASSECAIDVSDANPPQRLTKTLSSIDQSMLDGNASDSAVAAASVERSAESAGSLSAASAASLVVVGGVVGSGNGNGASLLPLRSSDRESSGVLSDGGGGGSSNRPSSASKSRMVPSLPTIAASPLGPLALSAVPAAASNRPASSPTKQQQHRGASASTPSNAAVLEAAAAAEQGFVTPRGSPWAQAPLGANEEAATTTAPLPPRSARKNSGGSASIPPPPPNNRTISSFRSYLHGELHPTPSLPTTDVAWGQTERQRVYNALLAVPAHLERLLLLGGAVCVDAWLAVLTLLPLRIAMSVGRGTRWLFVDSRRRGRREEGEVGTTHATANNGNGNPGALLYDALCFLIFSCASLTLIAVPVGSLYFWMKDMTQEFLKLHVIYTAVDIMDKVACSFSVDSLDALAGTCALFAAAGRRENSCGPSPSRPAPRTPRAASGSGSATSTTTTPSSRRGRINYARLALVPHLLADALVAGAIVTAHAFVLLAHGVALSVAMHSKRGSTLLALAFASNFVEIKSAVFKRYDGRKLYTLACQDCVERFHLLAALSFVLVEAAAAGKGVGGGGGAGGGGGGRTTSVGGGPTPELFWTRPDPLLLARCSHVFLAEVAIDVVKHAVLSKFNEVRPGMYREFARDVASAATDARRGHSHALYRRLLFDPLAPAALSVRMLATAAKAKKRQAVAAAVAAANAAGGAEAIMVSSTSTAAAAVVSLTSSLWSSALSIASSLFGWLLLWGFALLFKVGLGYSLRVGCAAYLRHYDRRHGTLKRD